MPVPMSNAVDMLLFNLLTTVQFTVQYWHAAYKILIIKRLMFFWGNWKQKTLSF